MSEGAPGSELEPLVRQAFVLEYFTIAWMVVECGVAIVAGFAARSIALIAFGLDSRYTKLLPVPQGPSSMRL